MFKGSLVGQDQKGNKYYKSNVSHGVKKEKRWVLYKNNDDPTNIDPHWHSWLHHLVNKIPNSKKKRFNWQKDRSPNFTGTKKAYLPINESSRKGYKNKKNKNYEAWTPNNKK